MEIKISKAAHKCFMCGRAFEHEDELNSMVRIEDKLLVREDYCPICWKAHEVSGTYSTWAHRYYDPKVAEQEPPEQFSPLRQLFYEAVELETREEIAKAYLAAQLLRRQKVFRLIKESDDADAECRVALFSDKIGNRLIEVRDPNLTIAEMEVGRSALMERLNELENPEEEVAEDESTEEEHDNAEPQEV